MQYISATWTGYRQLLSWLRGFGPLQLVGVEGAGAYALAWPVTCALNASPWSRSTTRTEKAAACRQVLLRRCRSRRLRRPVHPRIRRRETPRRKAESCVTYAWPAAAPSRPDTCRADHRSRPPVHRGMCAPGRGTSMRNFCRLPVRSSDDRK